MERPLTKLKFSYLTCHLIKDKPDKFENATFSPDRSSVHTKQDKFENGVFVAKTDKMLSVHIVVFEVIATEIM